MAKAASFFARLSYGHLAGPRGHLRRTFAACSHAMLAAMPSVHCATTVIRRHRPFWHGIVASEGPRVRARLKPLERIVDVAQMIDGELRIAGRPFGVEIGERLQVEHLLLGLAFVEQLL